MLSVSIIVAVAENGVIGAAGGMPWHLPGDLKRFRMLTMGKPMIMGRKTFESIGRALPGRLSVVVTRDREWSADGAVTASDLSIALQLAKQQAMRDEATGVSIIGGGMIYGEALKKGLADELHITRIAARPEGDTVFPPIDPQQWQLVSQEMIEQHEENTASATYFHYRRQAP